MSFMEKTILITGSHGFIGSNLKSKLQSKSFKISELSSNLSNHAAVAKEVRKINPDYVIHLSAATMPSYYFDHPLQTIQTNLIDTINLAETCRGLKNFKQFIFPSSVAVYAPMAGSKLNEKSKLQPLSSHGIAKIGCEYYLQYLNKIYGFPYTVLRLSNIYGRKNNDKYFIEKTISLMLKGMRVELGNPNAVRDWLYIEDALDAFIKVLGNKKAVGQTFLIGTGKGHSTKNVAEKIAKIMPFKGRMVWKMYDRSFDQDKIVCDYGKAHKVLGWKPNTSLESGLTKTIKANRLAL